MFETILVLLSRHFFQCSWFFTLSRVLGRVVLDLIPGFYCQVKLELSETIYWSRKPGGDVGVGTAESFTMGSLSTPAGWLWGTCWASPVRCCERCGCPWELRIFSITKPNSAPLFDLAQSGVHCDTHSAYSEAAKRWTLVSFWSSAGREMIAVVVQSPRQKKDAVNSPPGWQHRQHSASCVPQSGSVLILLKSHQCLLHVPSADGTVALSSWARAWFVSIWFSEETWSQLGQQKNPPGRILGGQTEGPCFSVTWWWLTPAAGGSPSTGQPPNWSSQKC